MASSFSIEIFGSRALRLGGKLICAVDEAHRLLFTYKSTDTVLWVNDHWLMLPTMLISLSDEKERFAVPRDPKKRVFDINDTAILYEAEAFNFRTGQSQVCSPTWKELTVQGFAATDGKEIVDLSTLKRTPVTRLSPPELRETRKILTPQGDMLVTVECVDRAQHLLVTKGKAETLPHPPTKVSHRGFQVGPHVYSRKDPKEDWQVRVAVPEQAKPWRAADHSHFVLHVDFSGRSASQWRIMNTDLV